MASRRRTTTTGLTVSPTEGGNALLAAWRGIRNLFGGTVERWEITPEGVTAHGFTVSDGFDASQIVSDLYNRGDGKHANPRLDLIELLPIVSGEEPQPFTNPKEMTDWMTPAFKGAGGMKGSPKYAKDAIQNYKESNGFAVPRGRPKKNTFVVDLDNLSAEALADLAPEDAEKLKTTLESLAPAAS